MTRVRLVAFGAAILLACSGPSAAPGSSASAGPASPPAVPLSAAAPTSTPPPTPKPNFPPGLYVVKPALDHPGGTLDLLESSAKLPRQLDFGSVGYDISADLFVSTTFDGVVLVRPDGLSQQMKVPGLFALGRPSLSPDSKQVFVQGTDTSFTPSPGTARPMDDTVWIVDLASGTFRRIGDKADPADPSTQSEQPLWLASGDRVAYWATEKQCLVIKVRDAVTAADVLTLRRGGLSGCYQPQRGILDGPRFHISASHDSSRILIVGQMQLYDAKTGALVGDIHQRVLDGVAAGGLQARRAIPRRGGRGDAALVGRVLAGRQADRVRRRRREGRAVRRRALPHQRRRDRLHRAAATCPGDAAVLEQPQLLAAAAALALTAARRLL